MKNIVENLIWGSKENSYSLSKQLARIITLICIVALTLQAIVMVIIIIRQYVRQERADTAYILQSDNEKMEKNIQYLEEIALTIRHNQGLRAFFGGRYESKESATEELENTASVFAGRNILENSLPFIEKIYIFNRKGESICGLYYPVTVGEYQKFEETYQGIYKRYKEGSEEFYIEVEDEAINLCMNFYDEEMKVMGTGIFSLNRKGIENNYANLEKMGRFKWSIRQGDKEILGKSNLFEKEEVYALENKIETGFGLSLHVLISNFVLFKALWSTIFLTLVLSFVFTLILSFFAHLLSKKYVKPLETVALKIKKVGEGDFNTKLGEYRAEELQNISKTFNQMTDYINRLIGEVYETGLMAKQAEIQYLQAQMQPHFLFNVLSMIEMKAAMNGDKDVQQLIFKLSKLYQGKIFKKNEPVIFLSEEMELAEFYLSIQNSRFGSKITYNISYDGKKEDFDSLLVPRLCIEPIVENAVCHGLEPKEENGHIEVRVAVKNEVLQICVEDDGIGFETEKMVEESQDKKHTHVGLWNTNQMIHTLYGKDYGLFVKSKVGEGTKVLVRLPINRKEDKYVESNDSGR